MSDANHRVAETVRAWDIAAGKYAETIDADVESLSAGVLDLTPPEREVLLPLVSPSTRLVHLLCSHGQAALGLWRATDCDVVGVDGSAAMLAIAREKARRLAAPSGKARFVQADVLAPPRELAGWATVLYTGSGAMPWVRDLTLWGHVVAELLAPNGRLVLYEGHPLNWVWDPGAETVQFRGTRSYFDVESEPNDDFPARATERFAPEGTSVPRAWEHHWTLGQIVTAVAAAGLRIERLVEYPSHFWPEFPHVPQQALRRLPHSFLLVAQSAGPPNAA
jgi:SAM-dependent methyltransferase